MKANYDVIVIGAGFAGAAAARECSTRGLRTLVLEGRDRVGGRTWTSHLSNGELIEIGGTYVHWLQPHTWSEITRYGLDPEVVEAADPLEWVLAPKGNGLEWVPLEEHTEREKALLERVFEPSATVLPRPFDPLFAREAVEEADRISIRERLDQLDLSPDDDAFLTALFTLETAGDVTESSWLSVMRWWAPAGHNYDAMEEAVFGYRLANGTVSLLGAMLADGGAELRLERPVTAVRSDDEGVEVTCATGESFTAAAVVVATPSGVWPHIEFSPPLAPERLEASGGLQVRRGSKVNVVLRGESRRFYVQPPVGHPIGFMWTSHVRSDDEQVAVLFGSPAMHDPSDPDEVGAAIRDLLPGTEVVEVVSGTYFDDDEFARGGWPFPHRGHLTRFAPHEQFARPEGRVVFASADIAKLWNSFIDGAIESGLRAGRDVREILGLTSGTPAGVPAKVS